MIDAKETAGALYGVWRIARCDENAFTFFKADEEGFWHSFTAAFVLAPFQALYQLTLFISLDEPPNAWRMAIIESLEYVILWVLFPLAMYYVARALDRSQSFFGYIVAYNWFQLGIGLIIMPWIILSGFNLMPGGLADFIGTMAFVAYTFYAAFMARVALDITVGAAIGIVLIDILLTLLVGQVTFRML